jgi:hypothetical protein
MVDLRRVSTGADDGRRGDGSGVGGPELRQLDEGDKPLGVPPYDWYSSLPNMLLLWRDSLLPPDDERECVDCLLPPGDDRGDGEWRSGPSSSV